jgi:hypothetical protein
MYNGAPATDVTSVGARRSSIQVAEDGIVGRGVLLDIPRLRGVDRLEPGELDPTPGSEPGLVLLVAGPATGPQPGATGVTVEQGDIVLVHTGRDPRRSAVGPWNTCAEGLAGLDPTCARWLHEKDPSVLGSDGSPVNPIAIL